MPEVTTSPNQIRLGICRYNITLRLLTDLAGSPIRLRPQSAHVLKILAEHLGKLVTKNDLIAAIWPDVSVTDDSLTQCIADIRKHLKDSDRNILRTVPKQGYILLGAPVSSDTAEDRRHPDITPKIDFDQWGSQEVPAVLYISRDFQPLATRRLVDILDPVTILHWPIKTQPIENDAVILTFATPIEAVRCAQALTQRAFDLSAGPLRMEIDVLAPQRDVPLGTLANALNPDILIVTVDIRDLLYNSLECDFEDLGPCVPDGKGDFVRAFKVHPYAMSRHSAMRTAAGDVLPTVAVLPLKMRNGSPENNALRAILADDIIFALSQAADINVISRLSTLGFQAVSPPMATIAKALNADFVLTGNCFAYGTALVVKFEFVDVTSGTVLWAEPLSLPLEEWIGNDEISNRVVNRLRRAISVNEAIQVRSKPLHSLKNYSLLNAAISFMHRLSWSDFQTARAMLDELIARTPDHPVVLSWIARWYVLLVQQGWTDTPFEQGAAALQFSSRALEVDPECTLALVSEGAVFTNLFRDLGRAKDRYDAALMANPNDPYGRLLRGTLYAFQGKGVQAVKDTDHAMHLAPLDPHSFIYLALGSGAYLAAENWEKAIELADASLRLNRSHASTLRIKSVAQKRFGLEKDAKDTVNELLIIQPGLTVSGWLKNSPSSEYEVGRKFAATLQEIGVPS
ncbi:winged helix-turn-helix domain-containing tetratricopeptide repeat protein [Parasedimentitalea marina]|uniref:winged helix-turn-helix domain-containing tetratricopeptide repeat protein n=1 Tax=Parasedimentitalea marina TaxID=2483033 RepID=UPI0013E2A543|nr:winged helix-turn-helix domain-containing protein [Parasedimentitalea marina]